MVHLPSILSLGIITASLVVARPTTDITLQERATCTFSGKTGAADVAKNKKSCSTITLSNVEVPAGTTLDLTGLNDGTKVRQACLIDCVSHPKAGHLSRHNHLRI